MKAFIVWWLENVTAPVAAGWLAGWLGYTLAQRRRYGQLEDARAQGWDDAVDAMRIARLGRSHDRTCYTRGCSRGAYHFGSCVVQLPLMPDEVPTIAGRHAAGQPTGYLAGPDPAINRVRATFALIRAGLGLDPKQDDNERSAQ